MTKAYSDRVTGTQDTMLTVPSIVALFLAFIGKEGHLLYLP